MEERMESDFIFTSECELNIKIAENKKELGLTITSFSLQFIYFLALNLVQIFSSQHHYLRNYSDA